ncbi:glycyl radical protein [Christensenellaceae bacterium OttesenSCG-928-K19]|nr:glycyl radical protein [Christensenellaceae bacterium OttesenSCG-928-K19]
MEQNAAMQMNSEVAIQIEDVMPKGSPEYDRCQRLRAQMVNSTPYFETERGLLYTESYKQTEGEHAMIRRAKALAHCLRNMSVYILPDEIIVGHNNPHQRSGGIFPEYAVDWIKDEIDTFPTRAADKFQVDPEQKRIFLEEIYPYWHGKTLYDRIQSMIPEDVRLQRYEAQVFSLGLHEDGGLAHVALNHQKILTRGFRDIRREIEELMEATPAWGKDALEKRRFWQACLIEIDAVIDFANRYADCAAKMAAEESDPQRKEELEEIARVCRRVPEYPAETFQEACQCVWFMQLIPQIQDNGTSYTPGRFDQYGYPYYKKDLDTGKLSKIKAQEILEAFWIKFSEAIKIYKDADATIHAGHPTGQNMQCGGIDRNGDDATNDLSYRMLESHSHQLLFQPNFTVRLHRRTPDDFLIRSVEAVRLGSGLPQMTVDETFVQSLTNIGVKLEDARDYVPVGCVEVSPLNTWGRGNGGYYNMTKVVELALNSGKNRLTGTQVGPKTQDPKTFQSIDDFKEAFKEQVNYTTKMNVTLNNIIDMVHEEMCPVPLVSMMVDDCVQRGKDVTAGGARYNWTAPLTIGIANAGDSMEGILRGVFIDKKCTMEELVENLDNDWKDNEALRLYFENKIPKYGNDNAEADACLRWIMDTYFDSLEGHETIRGGPFVGSCISIAANVPFGKLTGATPDGRHSGQLLADSISPANGLDRNGPTATMKSAVAAIDGARVPNGVIFNMKLNPGPLQTPEGVRKLADMIRSYVLMGGIQCQFNVISDKTMKDAQDNPDKYKGLTVRVAGYSAFFNELARDVQDAIITRTEHELMS